MVFPCVEFSTKTTNWTPPLTFPLLTLLCYAPCYDQITDNLSADNNLIGAVPDEVQYLYHMKTWITPFNSGLTSKSLSLDPFIKMADSLSHLEVQYCGFSGTIPANFASLDKLTYLGLGAFEEFVAFCFLNVSCRSGLSMRRYYYFHRFE